MNGFYTVYEFFIAFKLILRESKAFLRKTHTNIHQPLFAYIHANARTHTRHTHQNPTKH